MLINQDGTYLLFKAGEISGEGAITIKATGAVVDQASAVLFNYSPEREAILPLIGGRLNHCCTFQLSQEWERDIYLKVSGMPDGEFFHIEIGRSLKGTGSRAPKAMTLVAANNRALVSGLYPLFPEERGLTLIPAAAAFQSYGANYDELSNSIACQGIQLREAVKEFSQPRDDEDNTTHSIACTDITLTTVVKEFSQPRDDEDNTTHSLACIGITLDEVVVIHSQPRDDLDNTTHTIACIGIELNEA